MDSAFARFWWILRGGLAHYRLDKSLRPTLESPQNHRKILESFASLFIKFGFFIQKSKNLYKEKGREPMFQFALEKALLPFQHKTPAWAELFRLPLLF